MHEIALDAIVKQGVTVTFFLIFSAIVWWLYLYRGNEALEQHRFDVLQEDNNG